MNRKYAKLADGNLQYAPWTLKVERTVKDKSGKDRKIKAIVINPPAEEYAAQGWLPVVDERPTGTPEGKHAEVRGWEEADGAIRRVYEIVDDPPPPPRTFSKLKCVAALTQAGVWPQVKAWIDEAGLYDLYLAAQDFAEDDAYFVQGLAALKAKLGWTDAQAEALLSQCVKEGY